MRYTIRKEDKDPAYLQLYRQIRDDIVRGTYPCGTRLPSRRVISAEVGLSAVTVEHALEILCDEGYLEARERSGYYISYREKDVGHVAGENPAAPETEAAEDRAAPGDTGAAVPAGSTGEGIPYGTLARVMRRVLTVQGEKVLVKSPGSGLYELRSAIASYMARSRGLHVSPQQIVIGSGSEYLYSLLVQILGRDRIYALEDPSYGKIRRMYEANGVVCDMLRMGRAGIRSSELARTKASVLHVTPYNSYPSGITASASKRREYIDWAAGRKGYLIEDDFDSEFSVSSKAEDTLFSLEPKRSVIYLNTFSGTVSASMRIGYMILPEELTERYEEVLGFYSNTVPTFEQYVLAELIADGSFERHINRIRRKRRKEQAKE